MEAVQAITGSGGWPMSVFLTPDGRPFFGGTYFPPADLPGPASFRTVLAALAEVWGDRRRRSRQQADELSEAIASRSVIAAPRPGRRSLLDGARRAEAARPAGAGRRPSWPAGSTPSGAGSAAPPSSPSRAGRPGPAPRAAAGVPTPGAPPVAMAIRTLDAMAAGGIHDHLGGGFARYATDTEWLVPHFEKMLYDQAGLLRAYLHGWQVTGDPRYREVMDGIVGYVPATCRRPRAASTRPRTPTPRASRAASTCGPPSRSPTRWPTGWADTAGRCPTWFGVTPARQLRGHDHPAPAGRAPRCGAGRRRGGSPPAARRPARRGCGPGWTTRC